MGRRVEAKPEPTYSLGAVSRLTGLSPHVLRAWERRYQAIRPLRTPGGTRRYREADVRRLRRLRAATEAGHSISEAARLDDAELERRVAAHAAPPEAPIPAILAVVERLDAAEAERLLALQLAALGPLRFAASVAAPLLREIGERWQGGRLCMASEHLASSLVRSLLGASLRRRGGLGAPVVVFTTPPGERHELGVLMGAVAATESGAHAIYLGPDLPPAELLHAAETLEADAVALGVVQLSKREGERALRTDRKSVV